MMPQPDPVSAVEVVDAFTVGGGLLLGLLSTAVMLAYRKRAQLIAIDTWAEVRALLALLLPIGVGAWYLVPAEFSPLYRVGAAVTIAFFTALRMNTGPLASDEVPPPSSDDEDPITVTVVDVEEQ